MTYEDAIHLGGCHVVVAWVSRHRRERANVLEKPGQRSARDMVLVAASGMAITGAALVVSGLLAKAFFVPGSLGASVFTATAVLVTTGVAGRVAGPAILRDSISPRQPVPSASSPDLPESYSEGLPSRPRTDLR